MDRVEYQDKMQKIRELAEQHQYAEAADEIAEINWKRVRSAATLCFVGSVMGKAGRFEEGKELLLMAYDRSPEGRTVIYALAELAMDEGKFEEAEDYYRDYIEVAPRNSKRYELRYRLDKNKGASAEELIGVLEQLKARDFEPKWAYELAQLYHKSGRTEECVALCDEIVLWFGDSEYVEKALELKLLYTPLTSSQKKLYEEIKMRQQGFVRVGPADVHASGEILHNDVTIPTIRTDFDRYNTMNLQEEIAKSMQQIMDATEKEEVTAAMDNIHRMVEDSRIPMLQEIEQPADLYDNIASDEEIDRGMTSDFAEYLAEENGGQLSFSVDEDAMVEKQITGQMSIPDILADWEKTQHAVENIMEEAKQKRLENAKARALAETGNIMDKLAEVEAIVAEMDALSSGHAIGSVAQDVAQIVENSQKAREFETPERPIAHTMELPLTQTAELDVPTWINDTGNLPPMSEQMPVEATEDASEEASEEAFENAFETGMEDGFPAEEVIGEDPERSAEISDEVLMHATISMQEDESELQGEDEPEMLFESEDVNEETLVEDAVAKIVKDEREDAIADAVAEGLLREIGESPEKAAPKKDKPNKWDTLSLEFLTPEEKEIFSYFVPVSGMEKQICAVLQGVRSREKDGTSNSGNVLIEGGIRTGKTVLATNFIKVLQPKDHNHRKVGRVSGDTLNNKNIKNIVERIRGGYLIIEHASKMSPETMDELAVAMSGPTDDLVVFMEDTRKGMGQVLDASPALAEKFTEEIRIPIFTNDELVSFGKSYADELGYAMEEMAVLALYKKIGNIRRHNEGTTLTEVKEFIDSAIKNAEKPRLSNIFSHKLDDQDRVILREKDFA